MRFIGMIGVILGCACFGIIHAMSLSKNEKCIGAIIDSLRYMISELRAQSLPLPELMGTLSEHAAEEVRPLYSKLYTAVEMLGEESFESLWANAVMTEKNLSLSANQREIICKAGAFVGKFSVEEQTGALESCIVRLEPEYRLAAEKAREGRRLYPGLGVTAGIMLAVMFL